MPTVKGSASGVFHNVGQGLFYSFFLKVGSSHLSLLYDCGSFNEKALQEQIDKLVFLRGNRVNKIIDFAVISHFHKDHINGFKYLFEKGFQIKKLFVPFYHPIELFLVAFLEYIYYDDFDFNFYLRIYDYLADNVEELYIISPGEESFEGKEENPPDRGGGLRVNLEKYRESYPWIPSKGNLYTDNGDIVYYWGGKRIWKFKLFTCESEKDNLKEEFKEAIKQVNIELKGRGFMVNDDFIFPNGTIEEKKKFIELLKRKLDRKLIRNFYHNKNLVLLHYPEFKGKVYSYYSFFPYCKNYYVLSPCYCIATSNWGWALMGDVYFKEIKDQCWTKFKFHYSDYFDKVFAFQLPHHGSKKNWKRDFLRTFKKTKFWIASFGFHNTYGHPNVDVIRDINNELKVFVPVNENSFFYSRFDFET